MYNNVFSQAIYLFGTGSVVKHSVESMSDKTDRCLEVLENSQDKREHAFVTAYNL